MPIKIVLNFIRNISRNIALGGLAVILLGILIIIFPQFFAVIAGISLIIIGLIILILAFKINRYSKFNIKI